YDLCGRSCEGWATLSSGSRNGRWSGYAGFRVGGTVFFRRGHYEKALFPGELSLGRSTDVRFVDYRLCTGTECRLSPRHSLGLDLFCGSGTPRADDVFLAPESRRTTVGAPRSERSVGAELRYRFSGRWATLSLTGYATRRRGGMRVYRYYDDLSSLYCRMALGDIDRRYGPRIRRRVRSFAPAEADLCGVAVARRVRRRSPGGDLFRPRREPVERAPCLLEGFFVGDSPRRTAAAELRYSGRKMWTASLSAACAGGRFLSLAPLRRMRRAYDYALSGEEVAGWRTGALPRLSI
ncbi:MAG: hypothetical protein ACLT1W_11240, partial [Alistipes onderdonkii]